MASSHSSHFCSDCGAANQPQATYCIACGNALLAGMSLASASSVSSVSSAQAELLLPEHVLRERYRILQEIGQGGFGAVYKATDMRIADRMVAVKEMRPGSLGTQESTEATEAFKQEAFMLARLKHPNLPSIYDYFTDGGRCYVVMDFIEGQTLEDYLVQGGNGRPPGIQLPPAEVLQIGIQLCTVLDYLHTRQPAIIFRDLKPANVMRTTDGQLYLIDFGIARIFKQGKSNDTIALGSPGYAAPEQYGKAQSTPRSDIYGLGVTFHELLTGKDPSLSPFVFTAPIIPGYAELSSLIMRMVVTNPDNRPTNVAYIKQELQRMASVRPPGLTERSLNSQSIPPPTSPRSSAPPPPTYQAAGEMQPMHMYYQPNNNNQPPYSQPYQQPTSSRRGLSRRSVITGLVGLIVGGSVISYLFSERNSNATFDPGPGPSNNYNPPSSDISPNALLGLAWSPDGKSIVTSSNAGVIQMLDAKTQAVRLTYAGHSNAVSAVAWSPDSKRIASASYDQTVQIWEADTGRTLLTYQDHSGSVLTVAWSPNGKLLVSGSSDQTLKVWDGTSGKTIDTDFGHHDQVTSVAWSPDGQSIAAASADSTVIMFQAQPLITLFAYRGHADVVQAVAWSPNGRRIASASNDQTVQVWDADNGNNALIYRGHSDQVWAVAWSPNGERIASGSFDMTTQAWNAADGSVVFKLQDTSKVVSVVWSPDGHTVIAGDDAGNLNKFSL